MKYKRFLKKFNSQNDYDSQKDLVLAKPHVVLINELKKVLYCKHDTKPSIDYSKEYFTIEALEDGLTAQLSVNACEYRIDNGSWTALSVNTSTPIINTGQQIQFKIDNPTISSSYGIGTFTISKKCNVSGNIMSLLYGDDFEGQTDLSGKNHAFFMLFNNCTTLQNAENLILPATTLAEWCYSCMFQDCTSLTEVPQLPATTLKSSCYCYMFEGCTSLTTALEELPATTLADYCYAYMFYKCTSLTTAPELPATTLVSNCYYYMFEDCTSLTTAPELPAEILVDSCYVGMFNGCSDLVYIKMLATGYKSYCLEYWVDGVAGTGTFVKHLDMTSLPSGTNGIPNGWTVVNTFNNISPCIINQASESITFVYSDGLFTPTNEVIDLSQHFTKEELLSVQPECEITVTLLDKTDNVLASDYVWANDKTLSDVLNGLGVTKDVYDINVIITKVNAPEDNGYYYYYMLDETEPFVEKDWMRIVSLENDNTISLIKDIQYSVNGDDWRKLYANNTITVNSDDIVYFKGTNKGNNFTVNKAFNVEGNIMSLLYGDDFIGQIDLSGKDYAFYNLFRNCTNIVDASELILPATTLAQGCYSNMFNGCTSLTTAPELPATTLADYCYYYMFNGCTSLTTAPELPATTLASDCYGSMFEDCTSLTTAPELPSTTLEESCYSDMFSGCKSLTTAPELPATTLAQDCYDYMFGGCTSLKTAPELPATTLADSCYYNMFGNCTSLTTAPELPATTLAYSCYYNMFGNCTSLTTAPELPATTLADYCYHSMFYDCSKLNYIKMLATDISSTRDCLTNWVNGVASSGTFVKHKDMTSLPTATLSNSYEGIPEGWTVENA